MRAAAALIALVALAAGCGSGGGSGIADARARFAASVRETAVPDDPKLRVPAATRAHCVTIDDGYRCRVRWMAAPCANRDGGLAFGSVDGDGVVTVSRIEACVKTG